MNRKRQGGRRLLLGLALVAFSAAAYAQDRPSEAVLAGDDEPGRALRVEGIVYGPDGETPRAGIHVHVYHTDAGGLYAPPGAPAGTHRLQGDVWTDAEGRYAFRTIVPGTYPNGRAPAHVHYVVSGPGVPDQSFEMLFEGDPLVPARRVEQEQRKGRFGAVRPLTEDDAGLLHATFNLRLKR